LAYFLYILFFISCVVLIASVLLQPGKTDAGALFTSNISSTAFQPRGAQTILSKMTIAAATVFMLSALLLAMPALTGNISVLQTTAEGTEETAPALDANTDTSNDANANVDANSNTTINANVPSNTAIVIPANSNVNTGTTNK
jgi:protein translocase SecG subunit